MTEADAKSWRTSWRAAESEATVSITRCVLANRSGVWGGLNESKRRNLLTQ
jgi:hypothetical protein